MKAIVYTKYGSPDVLHLKEVEKPTPKDDEVLVRVHAVSINDWDWGVLTGVPREYRLISGLFRPKVTILGSDVAGVVEAAGRKVKNFKAGDEVYGDLSDKGGWGGFA
jgi:NADPH:quinone reductase-like Zn-dependent oxidoreductase